MFASDHSLRNTLNQRRPESPLAGWRETANGYEHIHGDWVDTRPPAGLWVAWAAGGVCVGAFRDAQAAMQVLDARRALVREGLPGPEAVPGDPPPIEPIETAARAAVSATGGRHDRGHDRELDRLREENRRLRQQLADERRRVSLARSQPEGDEARAGGWAR